MLVSELARRHHAIEPAPAGVGATRSLHALPSQWEKGVPESREDGAAHMSFHARAATRYNGSSEAGPGICAHVLPSH